MFNTIHRASRHMEEGVGAVVRVRDRDTVRGRVRISVRSRFGDFCVTVSNVAMLNVAVLIYNHI